MTSGLAPEPKLSKLAVAGLVFSLAFYPLLIVGFMFIGPCHPGDETSRAVERVFPTLIFGAIGLSLVLGIAAAIAIPKSEGRRWGLPFAWIGICHSLILILANFR